MPGWEVRGADQVSVCCHGDVCAACTYGCDFPEFFVDDACCMHGEGLMDRRRHAFDNK